MYNRLQLPDAWRRSLGKPDRSLRSSGQDPLTYYLNLTLHASPHDDLLPFTFSSLSSVPDSAHRRVRIELVPIFWASRCCSSTSCHDIRYPPRHLLNTSCSTPHCVNLALHKPGYPLSAVTNLLSGLLHLLGEIGVVRVSGRRGSRNLSLMLPPDGLLTWA